MKTQRPEVTVHAALLEETRRQILLVKCLHPCGKRLWGFPGGHIREGEGVLDALRREAKEETGYDIEISQLLGVYDNIVRQDSSDLVRAHFVNIVRTAQAVSGTLDSSKDRETLDARWFPLAEARRLIMSPTARRILSDAVLMMLYGKR